MAEKRIDRKKALIITSFILVAALLLIVVLAPQLNVTAKQDHLVPIESDGSVITVQDLYRPHIITDENISVYLDDLTFLGFWGIKSGSLWIDTPDPNYNLSAHEAFDSSSGGQTSLNAKDVPGNYVINVIGSLKIILGNNSISEDIWRDRAIDWDLTDNVTTFDIENLRPVQIEITTNCDAKIYILNTDLSTIYCNYVNSTSMIIKPVSQPSVGYYVIIVTDNGVGTPISVEYSQATQSQRLDNGALSVIILFIIIVLLVYIYFKYYNRRGEI